MKKIFQLFVIISLIITNINAQNITITASNPICGVGSSTTLTASGTGFYVWRPALGLNTTFGTSVIATPLVNTIYTVTDTSKWLISFGSSVSKLSLKTNGTLWAWGLNTYGQLGDGTTINKTSPVQIGTSNNWLFLSYESNSTLALKKDGTLWAWGYNSFGQLGDSSIINKTSPIQIGIQNNWLTVSTYGYRTLAIKKDGTLWAWGRNDYGQLGDGTTINKTSPIQIGTSNNWLSLSFDGSSSLALKKDGTLWAWGRNDYGQLGDGTTINKTSPIQIGTSNNWLSLSFDGSSSLALKKDGTLWAWGRNDYGQLGDGTIVNKTSPIQIGTSNNWLSLSFDVYSSSLALKKDGTLWAWGRNDYGQLGDGTIINKTSPIQIGTSNNWLSLNTFGLCSFALKKDGTLWAWGRNDYSQLGDGTTINKTSPVQIGSANNWLTVCNLNAIKTDGSLWAWGLNNYGQLGDSTNSSKSNPIQIGKLNDTANIALIINPKQNVGFKMNDSMQCQNISFIFTDTSTVSTGTLSRNWYYGDGTNGASVIASKTYTSANKFNVKMVSTSNNGCKDSVTKSITVLPIPNVNFSSNNNLCFIGNNFNFIDGTTITSGKYTRTWNFGDGTTDTNKTVNKHYSLTNTYGVNLVAVSDKGCTINKIQYVNIKPSPLSGALLGQNNGLSPSTSYVYNVAQQTGLIYKWTVNNGIIISGQGTNIATVQWINNGKGYIKVEVTNSESCTDTSSLPVNIGNVGTLEVQNNVNLEVFPNPNNGNFIIRTNNNKASKTEITIVNMLGQIVWRASQSILSGLQETPINTNISNGLYLLRFQNENGQVIKNIVIE